MYFKKESYDALVFDLDGTIVFNGYQIEANILENYANWMKGSK